MCIAKLTFLLRSINRSINKYWDCCSPSITPLYQRTDR